MNDISVVCKYSQTQPPFRFQCRKIVVGENKQLSPSWVVFYICVEKQHRSNLLCKYVYTLH